MLSLLLLSAFAATVDPATLEGCGIKAEATGLTAIGESLLSVPWVPEGVRLPSRSVLDDACDQGDQNACVALGAGWATGH